MDWSPKKVDFLGGTSMTPSTTNSIIREYFHNYEFFTEISRWVGDGVTLKSTYYGWWEVIALGPLLLM